MASQSDRTSDGFVIANGSQTVAVTAPEAETAAEGRTPFPGETHIISFSNAPRVSAAAVEVAPADEMMNQSIQGQGAGLPPEVRFWRSVTKNTGPNGECWTWRASGNQKGYGRFYVDGRHVMVHRFSYELHIGPIPSGLEVGHLCHNRRCVNPQHLEAMTHHQNLLMRFAREGAPCIDLGRPMTSAERNRRLRERRKAGQA